MERRLDVGCPEAQVHQSQNVLIDMGYNSEFEFAGTAQQNRESSSCRLSPPSAVALLVRSWLSLDIYVF